MNSVIGHFVILATTGGAICVMSYAVGWPRVMPPSEPTVSAIAVQRPIEANSPTPSARVQEVPVPRDIASLTREIQRELKSSMVHALETSSIQDALLEKA